MTNRIASWLGHRLARYLNHPIKRYEPFAISDPQRLAAALVPADVVLVEGNRRVSTAIKYLTQSTWSHAALYVGDFPDNGGADAPTLIEADMERGVIAVPLSSVAGVNTRVCRPIGLEPQDRQRVCRYVIERLGLTYDLKNVIDLARYLLPVPPVPVYWRRRMLALGSGDPTRAICSTLIAQAFESVRYPILPRIERRTLAGADVHAREYGVREILHIRHYSLFTPRDFDISPYFRIINPTIEGDFDYLALHWGDQASAVSQQGQAMPQLPTSEIVVRCSTGRRDAIAR